MSSESAQSSASAVWSAIVAVAIGVALVVGSMLAGTGAVATVVAADNTTVIEAGPELETSAPDARYDPGETGVLEVEIKNFGELDDDEPHPKEAKDRALNARDTVVEITDVGDAPIEVRADEEFVGAVEHDADDPESAFFEEVVVDDAAEAGTYEIEVTLNYTDATEVKYEFDDDAEEYVYSETTERVEETRTVEIEIEPEVRFEVTDVDHNVTLGDDGELRFEVENDGDADATDAVVTAISGDQDVFFGPGNPTAETYVGEWGGGETVELEFRAGTVEDANERSYPIELEIEYDDEDGQTQTDTVLTSFTPEPRQSFAVLDSDHDVGIDDQGELEIEIENEGPEDASDAVVVVESQDTAVEFNPDGPGTPTSEAFVGEFEAGETATVSYQVGTTSDAIQKPYPIEVSVEYEDEEGLEQTTRSDTIEFVPEAEQEFEVIQTAHDVGIDDQGELEIELENQGPADASEATVIVESQDAAVEFNPDGPGTPTSEAFVGEFETDETATVSYQIGTTSDAIQKPYPIEVTVEYEDEEGNDLVAFAETIEFVPEAEQTFAASTFSHDVAIDDQGELTVEFENRGPDNVSEATLVLESQDLAIEFNPDQGGTPTAETSLGEVAAGETRTPTFRVGATSDAIQQPYPIEATVEYEDEEGTEHVSQVTTIELVPLFEQQFGVTDVDHDVTIDDRGELTIEIENDGPHDALDATVVVESQDSAVEFNPDGPGTVSSETFVGDILAGSSKTATYSVGTTSDALQEPYPIDVTVEYETRDGDAETGGTTFGFVPLAEQQFEVADVDHDVTIGDHGILDVAIENSGPVDARDAVVTAEATDPAIQFGFPGTGSPTAERVLGDVDANDGIAISYRVATTEQAIVEPYPIDLTIEYDDADGDERTEQTLQVSLEPEDEQTFSPTGVDHDISIDDAGTLSIEIENEGPRDAYQATVTAETQDPALQFNPDAGGTPSTELGVDEWEADEELSFEYRLAATSDAIETSYPIDVTIDYEDEDGDDMATQGFQVEIEPDSEQQFVVRELDHSVAIDDDGIVELEIENRGPNDARDAAVTLESVDNAIQIGSATDEPITAGDVVFDPDEVGSPISEAYVGEWEAGERRTVRYVAAATDDAIQREYPLEVTIDYEDDDGESMTPQSDRVGMEPFDEQEFAIDAVESSLRVGQDGDLEGELENTGDHPVDGVVVRYDTEIDNVAPREASYAVGSLEPGESEPIDFRIGVTDEAEPGPRTFEFVVRYRNPQGDIRVSDTIDVIAEIDERRDRFDARVANSTVTAGESEVVDFEIENREDETLRNIRVKLFTSSPLDSGDTEAFIPELEPGETETVPFEIEAEDGAVPRTYPVSMDFRFDDERNETQLSRTQNVPVAVTSPDDDGFGLWLWAVAGLAIVAGTVFGVRRYGLSDRLPGSVRSGLSIGRLGEDSSDDAGGSDGTGDTDGTGDHHGNNNGLHDRHTGDPEQQTGASDRETQ